MTIDKAQQEADKIFGTGILCQKSNGICKVTRARPDGGFDILGTGHSWLAALRYAAKPVLEVRRKAEAEARVKNEYREREAAKELDAFMQFLRESHDAEFKAWLSAGADT